MGRGRRRRSHGENPVRRGGCRQASGARSRQPGGAGVQPAERRRGRRRRGRAERDGAERPRKRSAAAVRAARSRDRRSTEKSRRAVARERSRKREERRRAVPASSRGDGGGWRASVAVWRAPRASRVTVPAPRHRGRSGGPAASHLARRDREAGRSARLEKEGAQSSSGHMMVRTGSASSPGPITAFSVTRRETPPISA